MARRILVLLESRATYGYSRNVMRAMKEFPNLELTTLVTGMHLMAEMGNSIELIEADGFPISATVPLEPSGKGRAAWSEAMGRGMAGFASAIDHLSPDIILLSGDRAETLTMCVTAAYMGIPLGHIQAGDKSGHIDDAARYAIAKLAHIHFASCADSADRLHKLGEQPFRIFNIGAPQLDDMIGRDFKRSSATIGNNHFQLDEPYILLVQHPVMAEREQAGHQIIETLKACLATGHRVVWIYPNSDLGFSEILSQIEQYRRTPRITVFANLERDDFLTLLANAAVLVGNSSSGILEAPTFKVPVVNIGNRQRGRPQASNILNCGYTSAEIGASIHTALTDAAFRKKAAEAVNPYGDGQSGPRICQTLSEIALDSRLIDKESTY